MKTQVTTADGVRIAVAADMPSGSGPHATVLFVHGYGSHKASYDYRQLSPLLQAAGIATVCFDFRGSGESGGRVEDVTITSGLQDIAAVMQWLLSQSWIDANRLGIFGFSYGGLISLLYLEDQPQVFRAAVLKAPSTDWAAARRARLGPDLMQQWQVSGYHDFEYPGLTVRAPYAVYEDALTYDAYQAAHKMQCSVLIWHGDKDESVPLEQSKKLVTAIGPNAKLNIVPGADHRFYAEDAFAQLREETKTFFVQHLT